MRDILFKAKRVDNGEWVYGDVLHIVDCTKIREQDLTIHFSSKTYVVDKDTLCQYIGLDDKNGVKIFEGDIVKAVYGNIGFVYFNTHFMRYHIKFTKASERLDDNYLFDWIYPHMLLEVIGNIHDKENEDAS